MTDLDKLQRAVIAFRDERDWKQFHNPKDAAISLVLEATELLEHFQWKTQAEIESHLKNKHRDVSEELVDVLYWVLLIAHDLEIPIETAFMEKLEKNGKKYPISKSKGKHTKYTEL